MTVLQAINEEWISQQGFNKWLQQDEVLKSLWEDGRKSQKEWMLAKAMENVENALYWEVKLRPSELINISLRFLEKVSPDFKDKVELNGKVEWEFSTSLDELIRKANELSKNITKNENE